MDRAGKPEDRGNAGETAESFFHPSRPSGFGCLVQHKRLIRKSKAEQGAGGTPVHLENPGLREAWPPSPPPCPSAPVGGHTGCGVSSSSGAQTVTTICSPV